MKCIYIIFLLLFSSLLYSQDAQVQELLNKQEQLLLNLSNIMQKGQQETLNLKNSLQQKEQEIISLKKSSKISNQNLTDILNQKEIELQQKDSLLKALQESSEKDQKSLKSLSTDIGKLNNIISLLKFWNKISLSVLIALVIAVTVETIILIKK